MVLFLGSGAPLLLDEIKDGTPHNLTPFKKLDAIALYLASYAKNNHPVGSIVANGRFYTGNVLFPQISDARQSRFLLRVFTLVVLGESNDPLRKALTIRQSMVNSQVEWEIPSKWKLPGGLKMGFRCQCDYQG